MSFSSIPPQKHFFYESKWSKEMDATFLNTIIEKKGESYPLLAHNSAHTCFTALLVVNAKHICNLHWEDAEERIEYLERRYRTFKKISQLPQTHWDLGMNCIIADEHVLKEIFKENIFAQAYYHEAEPEFAKLATVFGPNNVKVEVEHTIINISDSTVPKEGAVNVHIINSDEDEVTSPMPKDLSKMRRRLFDDEGHSTTLQASANFGHLYVGQPPFGPNAFLGQNAFPLKPKGLGTTPNIVSSSSCASSSPAKQ